MSRPTPIKAGASNPPTQSFAPVTSIRPVMQKMQWLVKQQEIKDLKQMLTLINAGKMQRL